MNHTEQARGKKKLPTEKMEQTSEKKGKELKRVQNKSDKRLKPGKNKEGEERSRMAGCLPILAASR